VNRIENIFKAYIIIIIFIIIVASYCCYTLIKVSFRIIINKNNFEKEFKTILDILECNIHIIYP